MPPKSKKPAKRLDAPTQGHVAFGQVQRCAAAAAFVKQAKEVAHETWGEDRDDVGVSASELDENFRYLVVPDLMHQWALGRVGYVLGRIKLSVGMEGASKSSALYYDCGLVQAQGGLAGIVAVEEADSTKHIENYVPFPQDLILWRAKNLEEGIDMTYRMQKLFKELDPENKYPKVQGFDSIAGATEQDQEIDLSEDADEEENPDASKSRVGGIAKIMKTFFNAMKGSIPHTNTLWHVVNQAREQIYTGYGAEMMQRKPLRERLAITGGKAQRFMASYFEFLQRAGTAKDGDGEAEEKISAGFNTVVDWIKNKPRFPDRKITRGVRWGQSFYHGSFTVEALAASGVCGLTGKLKRYWCPEIGVTEKDKLRADEIYPIIHAPENIWKFQEVLGILGAVRPDGTPVIAAAPTEALIPAEPEPAQPNDPPPTPATQSSAAATVAAGGGLPPPTPAAAAKV